MVVASNDPVRAGSSLLESTIARGFLGLVSIVTDLIGGATSDSVGDAIGPHTAIQRL